ncbi:MAG: hypothetical protein ACPGRX_03440, partial [Bdellovibrionales bacterium]
MTNQNTENFKHVTSAVLRTIAGRKELEPTYSTAEPPTGRVFEGAPPRLPQPDAKLSAASKRLVRGCADVQAVRLAHHDARLHLRLKPRDNHAASVFAALEQARCEALGAREMAGAANNMRAVLAEKCKRLGLENTSRREQTDTGDALHILARLALTGEPAPPAAAKLIELWQPWLDARMRDLGFDTLRDNLADQAAFAGAAKQIIKALEMQIDEDSPGDEDAEDGESDAPPEQQEQSAEPRDDQDSGQENDNALDEDAQAGADDDYMEEFGMDDMLDDGSFEDGGESPAPAPIGPDDDFIPGRAGLYRIYTTAFDEEIEATELADSPELVRLRAMLDKQLSAHQTVI